MKKTSLLLLLCSFWSFGQNIPIDTWRSHYSYKNGRILEQANETIFCAVENGLFTFDLASSELQVLSKVNGLSDSKITALHFAQTPQVMMIGYQSGSIDLIKNDGTIKTILTIRDAPIVASKSIKSITSNGTDAYLATGFGIVYLNLATDAVVESYRSIGVEGAQLSVYEVFATEDSLFAISGQGIQAGSFQDNLLDFNDWMIFEETFGSSYEHLVSTNDGIRVIEDDRNVWSFNGVGWESTGLEVESSVNGLYFDNTLFAITDTKLFSIGSEVQEVIGEGSFYGGNDFIQVDNNFWIADGQEGLIDEGSEFSPQIPKGPLNDSPSRIRWQDEVVFALFGPVPSAFTGSRDDLGYSYFENAVWNNEDVTGFSNITDVASINGQLIFTSLGDGVYDAKNDIILNQSNSNLEVSDGIGTTDITSARAFNESIYVTAYNTVNSLYKLENGQFTAINEGNVGTKYPIDIEISQEGVLWIRRSSLEGGGLAVYNPSSIEQRTFTSSSGLPSNQTSGIAIDSEDRAWISTSNGLSDYEGASYPFNSFNITVPIFQNGFLFEDEQINDVLTDGGDRIWVATEQNGVWVLASDLSEVVAQYTTKNSPLPSNSVRSFAYDETNGEVFISTNRGMVSYRSASSEGLITHNEEITVFPNPVPSGFSGQVGINGLVRNAVLKITDVRGRLVKELKANGSSASWDLRTHTGGRSESGIYLIFSSSEDGQETLVGKIAVLK